MAPIRNTHLRGRRNEQHSYDSLGAVPSTAAHLSGCPATSQVGKRPRVVHTTLAHLWSKCLRAACCLAVDPFFATALSFTRDRANPHDRFPPSRCRKAVGDLPNDGGLSAARSESSQALSRRSR